MAFTSEILDYGNGGDSNYVRGTFENTLGSTGGVINTGLNLVKEISFVLEDTAQNMPAVDLSGLGPNNKFLSDLDGEVTIITDADAKGQWTAKGY